MKKLFLLIILTLFFTVVFADYIPPSKILNYDSTTGTATFVFVNQLEIGISTTTRYVFLLGSGTVRAKEGVFDYLFGDGSNLTGIVTIDVECRKSTNPLVYQNYNSSLYRNEFSTDVYVNGKSSATEYYGDGSNLTGITAGDNLGNHIATQILDLDNNDMTNIDQVYYVRIIDLDTEIRHYGDTNTKVGFLGDIVWLEAGGLKGVKIDGAPRKVEIAYEAWYLLYLGPNDEVKYDFLNDKIYTSPTGAYYSTRTATTDTYPANGFIIYVDTLSAVEIVDRSPFFEGDALTELKKIKPKLGTSDGIWAEVDHDTLPCGMKHTFTKDIFEHKISKEQFESVPLIPTLIGDDTTYTYIFDDFDKYEEKTIVTGEGRNVGKNIQLNTRAIVQLLKKIEQLESRVTDLESQ